jgi:SRSO17 transposase
MIVDDSGFPKKGKHSVGVARQYCGQLGKQENCQVAVSLSVTTDGASLPIAWQLYLPEVWATDKHRREKTGIPEDIQFRTKPEIALAQIRQAVEDGVPVGPVLADAAYGNDSGFRQGITKLGLSYAVGVQSSMSVWKPSEGPLPKKRWTGKGRPPILLQEQCLLAGRSEEKTGIALRSGSRSSRTSRLLAEGSAPHRVAGNRVARQRAGTNQVLVVYSTSKSEIDGFGLPGQTPLDHRTRL